jgi:hypothetical protein
VAEVIALSIALVCASALAWDGWRRYLAALDRTAGLRKLESDLVARIRVLEVKQAEHARALGGKALQAARHASEA